MRKILNKLYDLISKLKYISNLNEKAINSNQFIVKTSNTSEIDIVTIAYNDAKMIEYQIKLIERNVLDNFTHIIADNSSDIYKRKLIENICTANNILYYSIPVTNFTSNASHAFAIHWSYKNIIRKRNMKYFGFIDHDIFPLKKCLLLPKFKNGIYGRVTSAYNENENSIKVTKETPHWSLWAGFFFFNSALLVNKNIYCINFSPKYLNNGSRLDTIGGLWDVIFSKIAYPGDALSQYNSKQFRNTLNGNVHTDYYETIDEWMHIGNLSNWHNTPNFEDKYNFFTTKLENVLNSNNID